MDKKDKLKRVIELKKVSGSTRKPKYATRKLSIGLVSCMLGYALLVSPSSVEAAGGEDQALETSLEADDLEAAIAEVDSLATDLGLVEEPVEAVSEEEPGEESLEEASAEETPAEETQEEVTLYQTEALAKEADQAQTFIEVPNKLTFVKDYDLTEENYKSAFDNLDQEVALEVINPIDTSALGQTTGKIRLTFADGSSKEFDLEAEIIEEPKVGTREISTDIRDVGSENLDVIDKKYNFNVLDFITETLNKDSTATAINFEMQGQHAITASTDNWVVNLVLDERIAKYVDKITIEATEGVSDRDRVFVQQADALGRPSNLWQVNYIRGSNGLFPGSEFAQLHTAPNGLIHLTKPINEILEEIGYENLLNNKLRHRTFLTSNQDNGAVVSGLDHSGVFFVEGIDQPIEDNLSQGNEDWFTHSSVNLSYLSPDQVGNSNGALVVDQLINKKSNFGYISAKNKQWVLKYGLDQRIAKYVDSVDLHKMKGPGGTIPDYSFNTSTNPQVAETIPFENREGQPGYGYGSFTDNTSFTRIVEFRGGQFTPISIRYVYNLNTPLNDILAELKQADGLDQTAVFGKDFSAEAWITDNSGQALINNTYGIGYFPVRDTDGDTEADRVEVNKDESPYIANPEIVSEDIYLGDTSLKAKVFLSGFAGKGNIAQLVDEEGNIISTIENVDAVDEFGNPSDVTKELEFEIDPSLLEARQNLLVQIVSADPMYGTPEKSGTIQVQGPIPTKTPYDVKKNADISSDNALAQSLIANADELPEGTTYSWKENPDTSTPGSTTGIVLVKVPARENPIEVKVPLNVLDEEVEEKDNYTPLANPISVEKDSTLGPDQAKEAIKNNADLPADAQYSFKEPVDTSTPGEKQATVVVTYSDGSVDEVDVPVTVFEKPELVTPIDKVEVEDTSALTDEEKEKVKNNVTESNPELPDGTDVTIGDDGTATITYPDGTKDTISGEDLVVEKKPELVTPTDKVEVEDTSALTDEEKEK
ncbi:MAG: Rib/alpha-like domain-containing protein, partial [Anaerococcus sp.]|nr:Rib/alpha-like domain-containing protein [Anaerococcus sp.]